MAANDSNSTQQYSHPIKEFISPSSKIPGGGKKQLPEEPKPIEKQKQSNMGCAPFSKPPQTVDEHNTRMAQEKITDHFKTSRNDDTHSTNSKAEVDDPNSNRSATNRSAEGFSDEDRENDSSKQKNGPVTRSSTALSKLSIKFEDSDGEEHSSYTSWSKRDIAEYRNHYPDARQYSHIKDNYKFYTNEIQSYPDGDYIDNIHKKWFGDYRKLEFHHGYIQWIFPLQEKGLNFSAEPLQKHEIDLIKSDDEALRRIVKSYRMMLDFYGFELVDEDTGEIRRNMKNYAERFRNLNTSSHNYLRITRILKCLGEFDYEYLKFPFLERILEESITKNKLPNCLRSCKDYWIGTLRSSDERRAIRAYARDLVEYRNKGITPPPAYCARRPEKRQESARPKQKTEKSTSRPKSTDANY